jgi:DNA excision repair protein ERCC-6
LNDAESSNVTNIDRVNRVEDFQEDNTEEKDMLDAVCNTSVESAYEHDRVVNAKKIKADRRLTELEADHLNERTVKFLREQASKAYFERRGGNLPQRNETKDILGMRRRHWSLGTVKPLVVRYLKRAGGKARSAMLVDYFNREYSSIPSDLFTQALRQVATMQQMPRRGGSIWHLKPGQEAGS